MDCGHLVRTDLRILEFGGILYDRIITPLEKELEISKPVRSDKQHESTSNFISLLSEKHEFTLAYGDSADLLCRENLKCLRAVK